MRPTGRGESQPARGRYRGAVDATVDAERLVADLDGDQRRAVTTDSRLVAVIAGAGSGKTRVLTRRVAWRVATGSAEPGFTLVLTFTREAAGELRRRLPAIGVPDRVTAGTFHSVAHGLLRQRWADLGKRPRDLLPDRERLLRSLIGARGGTTDGVLGDVNWATARGLSGIEFTRAVHRGELRPSADATAVAGVLDAYRAAKAERHQIDVDDLLLLTIEELQRDEAFAAGVRWRFRHLLVDEAQDLNPLQHRLVDLLSPPGDPSADLFLVGDPAQAIYGFNGADPELLNQVESHFPGIEVIRLPVNHRCTPQVVAAGAAVLAAGDQPTDIRSARPDGSTVSMIVHADETAEARSVAARLARLDPGLIRDGRVAVLARTHAALTPIAAALAEAAVPVRHAADGPGSALVPFLRLAYRISHSDELRHWAHNHLEEASELASEQPAAASAMRTVAEAVLDYLGEQPTGDGGGLRAWVAATDPFGAATAGVELLTFHAAKGREWHTVVLVGCETGLVPHRSARTQVARAEEARLLYVAVTRATDELTISAAERRGGYQRKLTPLVDGFESTTPPPVAPPAELMARQRSPHDVLVERLRAWRGSLALSADVLPEAVCSDRTLAVIARNPPTSSEELDAATGLGALTSRRLWPTLRDVLSTIPD